MRAARPAGARPLPWRALGGVFLGAALTPRSRPFAGQKKELQELYQLGPQLGRGGFGTVFAGSRLADGSPVSGRYGRARAEAPGRGWAGPELSPLCPCLAGGSQARGPGERPALGRARE